MIHGGPDRWMAEKLMGWHLADAQYGSVPGYTRKVWVDKDGERQFLLGEWHPTKSIAQVFQYCVPKMREKGFNFNLNWQGHPGITVCIVQFHKFDLGYLEHGQGSDDDPSTAICKAIHAALEGE